MATTGTEEVLATLRMLDQLEQLLEIIPPGPWHVERESYLEGGEIQCSLLVRAGEKEVCRAEALCGREDHAAFAFIAACRVAVPAMLAVMRDLLEYELARAERGDLLPSRPPIR